MDARPIGIFDSGVGGMTVYSEMIKELPNENILYLGDTKNFPYGSKSKENIIRISNKCAQFLVKQDIKMLVIACGTATSQALESLKENFEIPIVGIIQPTVESIKKERKKEKLTIGVMATEGTIRSGAWEKQIKEALPEAKVINQACPLLAPMAEEGWTKNQVAKEAIREYMKVFEEKELDQLILGCTHYPLFQEIMEEELKQQVEIINTGTRIASYLKNYLEENYLRNDAKRSLPNKIFLTDIEENFIKVAKNISKDLQIEQTIEKVTIEG